MNQYPLECRRALCRQNAHEIEYLYGAHNKIDQLTKGLVRVLYFSGPGKKKVPFEKEISLQTALLTLTAVELCRRNRCPLDVDIGGFACASLIARDYIGIVKHFVLGARR